MASETDNTPKTVAPPVPETRSARVGKFIQTYHSFLSSFVIGAAGLIATSIWQFRQSETARRQAEAQQAVAKTQADNNWKIERAEILAKNLQVLTSQGGGNVEQRYGVLLSLTRGNILDSELAVSYALELGKENPDYMRSVLANTSEKDYWRLARAFEPTCEQRYGVSRNVDECKIDKLAERSGAIADLILDDVQAGITPGQGPMALLVNEAHVQPQAMRLRWLFDPALIRLYERRQWKEIQKFESVSSAARLVSALVLSAARTGELVSAQEAAELEKFHSEQRKWLTQYMEGRSCDAECRGRLVEVMLTGYAESQGDYDQAMRALLTRPRAVSGTAVSHLHTRLLWCQADESDVVQLRDRVLVPAATEAVNAAKDGHQTAEDLVGLLALVQPPKDGPALEGWKTLGAALEKSVKGRYAKLLAERRTTAARERASPTPTSRKTNFCSAPPAGGAPPLQRK